MGNPFKAIWKGLKVTGKTVAKYSPVIELFAPGTPVALVASLVGSLVNRAEDKFPQQGSGKEKSAWVTVESLRTLEVLTGKNFDSPQGRALIQELINADVEVKNLVAQAQAMYDAKLAAVHAYVASVTDSAKDDTE